MLLNCSATRVLALIGRSLQAWRERVGLAALAVATALAISACGSTSTTSVGPTPIKCDVSLSGPNSIGPAGGTGTIAVATQAECSWTVSTQAAWITRLSPRSGQGSGQIQFDAAPNPVDASRQADIVVNDSRIQIRQDFASCVLDVSPTALSVSAAGGAHTIKVAAGDGCGWSASSGGTWIVISSGGSGIGNGSVNVQVAANSGSARAASLTIAGRTVTVSQSAAGTTNCSYAIQPTSHASPASGGPASVSVTGDPGCAWTAASDVSWIGITSGVAGNGNGSVGYNVEPNTSAARTGRLTVAGQTLTVNQAPSALACDYSIQPTSRSVGASGGPVSVAVGAAAGCIWAAASHASWITIATGAAGNGNGSVNLDIAANVGVERTGTLTIAGRTFTVTQVVGCAYSVQPVQLSIGAGGGASGTSISSGAGCAWTASSHDSWITITSDAAGSGAGTVSFDIAANASPQRIGTVTVAGQIVTVTQASGCSYILQPSSQSVGAGGGAGSTFISVGPGCPWTASSNVPWITVTSGGSGSGSDTVSFDIDANVSPARVGTLTIANRLFTVSQASGCTYAVQPLDLFVSAAGGPSGVSVNSGAGCPWTSVSNAPWIVIGAGSGSGSGAADFNVTPNIGPQRTGVLTIAGRTVIVTQASGCTYTLSSTSETFGSAGGTGTVMVTTFTACAWTAVSNVPWITVLAGESESGPGTVVYTVMPLVIGKRSGSITIAGQTFFVSQPN